MTLALDDTIAAIASAPGGSARGIVRLSGPGVPSALERVLTPDRAIDWRGGHFARAFAGAIVLGGGFASPLPCEVYYWPTARSYTGQPVAEIHTLGSPPLLEAALGAVCAAGARLAEPGEFTLRAFLAGKMDLPQAEAVLGVIDAADPHALNVALSQLAGGLSTPLGQLREQLLDLLAHLEVGFDFADEDLPLLERDALAGRLAAAEEAIGQLLRRMSSRRTSSELPRVVFVGLPNTGKSSLFNVLAGRDAAIVSDHPGTTRDYLHAEAEFHGQKCLLVDTAGIAADGLDSGRGPDAAAQAAATEQAQRADVRLLCLDASRPLHAWERRWIADKTAVSLVVWTKVDAAPTTEAGFPSVRTSSVTGEGIAELRTRIAEAILAVRWSDSALVPGTAERCHETLRLAAECLARARDALCADLGDELVAAEIRLALDELGRVIGAVYTEDLLDRVFSRFCVGK